MGKTERRETRKARPPAEAPAPLPSFEPLPPPRPNKALLAVAILLTAGWIAFLLFLFLRPG